MKSPRNSRARGCIQAKDDCWPHQRADRDTHDPELHSYLDQIRNMLTERPCIRRSLSQADELPAREWHALGATLQYISQAVLTGCAREYVSWCNCIPSLPIASLAYFKPILADVKGQIAPVE